MLKLLIFSALFYVVGCQTPLTQKPNTQPHIEVGEKYQISRFLPAFHPVYIGNPTSAHQNKLHPDYIMWDLNEDGVMDGIARINDQGDIIESSIDANFDGSLDP